MTDHARASDVYRDWPAERLWRVAVADDYPTRNLLSVVPRERRQQVARRAAKNARLMNLFLPVPVNPSRPDRTRMILGTFVYAEQTTRTASTTSTGLSTSINWSEDTLDTFVDTAVARALQLRSPDRLAHQSYPRAALVKGDKGIGKTHLQNFVLSKYSGRFDRDRPWIRLTLFATSGTTTPST